MQSAIRTQTKSFCLIIALLACLGVKAAAPAITALNGAGELVWTNPVTGVISQVERSTNLVTGPWTPVFYDWATNGTLATPVPPSDSSQSFYRINVLTSIPDPSLVMHLSFDNKFSDGTVLDVSGHGNHGLRYGRPNNPTNWPSKITGPDGSQAAEFHWYVDGYGLYGKSGDYIGIPSSPSLINLSQATITVWVHYYRSFDGNILNDQNTSILDAGKDIPGSWNLGRVYSDKTAFNIATGSGTSLQALQFPDPTADGDSGNWHYYTVTFDNGTVRGYFDGKLFKTTTGAPTTLTIAGYYISIGGWTFNSSPEMDLSKDEHPNNAWINGTVDDVRIYNRTLSDAEVATLYGSFDKIAPTMPTNLTAGATASSQIAVRWTASTDLFGVAGYVLRRNGTIVSTNIGTTLYDNGLTPDTAYSYTLQAFDAAGNASAESAPVNATTLSAGSPVTLILDDSDGLPWIQPTGEWYFFDTLPGYYGTGFLSDERRDKGKTLTYRPSVPEAGTYSLYVQFPGRDDITHLFSDAIPLKIVHDGATNSVTFSEKQNFGTWNLIGQFPFSAGTNDFLQFQTAGTDSSEYVFVDGVKLVK